MGYKTGTVIIENQPGFQEQCDDKIIKQTGDFIIDPFDQYIFSGGWQNPSNRECASHTYPLVTKRGNGKYLINAVSMVNR